METQQHMGVEPAYPEKKGRNFCMDFYYKESERERAISILDIVKGSSLSQRNIIEGVREVIEHRRERGVAIHPIENYMYTHSDEMVFSHGYVMSLTKEEEKTGHMADFKVSYLFTYE